MDARASTYIAAFAQRGSLSQYCASGLQVWSSQRHGRGSGLE